MFLSKHYVSTKVALYSHDLKKVLIMHYPGRDIYGLPGGHVDAGETPDQAMNRELEEELSISIEDIQRTDFFFLNGRSPKIILGYTAICSADVAIIPTDPSFEYALWMTKEELHTIDISPDYIRFIVENWPND